MMRVRRAGRAGVGGGGWWVDGMGWREAERGGRHQGILDVVVHVSWEGRRDGRVVVAASSSLSLALSALRRISRVEAEA